MIGPQKKSKISKVNLNQKNYTKLKFIHEMFVQEKKKLYQILSSFAQKSN